MFCQIVDRKSSGFLPIADRLGIPVVINSASMLEGIDETWALDVPAPYSGLYATVREWLQNCWGRFGGGVEAEAI